MSNVIIDISTSLDGYVAGPDPTDEEPLGRGGERLHEWLVATQAFQYSHGRPGSGEDNPDSRLAEEYLGRVDATIMGRRMFSGGEGDWAGDGNARGWWGDEPPFHHDVFVLTHHAREPLVMEGGTTFHYVTDGIESALRQARAAAGDGDVGIAGGAEIAQQYLRAGLVDELRLHIAPVFLGGGTRLFDAHVGEAPAALERTSLAESPTGVVHVAYRVPS